MNFQKQIKILCLAFATVGCTAQKDLFAPDTPYVFPGIGNVNTQSDGSLILSWESVPVEGSNYFVFKRAANAAFDWKSSFSSTLTTSMPHPSYPLDQKYCFAVRFVKLEVAGDTNVNEICPTLPYIEGFTGIESATSANTGVAVITWQKPTTGMDEVEGYRIYSGTDFKKSEGSATARDTSVSIAGLTPDETYTFGVRAYDKYGREDTNTRTVSVGIVNNALPMFGGVDTLAQESSSSIKVVWASADIKPARYNIYKATGAANSTVAVPTTTAYTTASSTLLSKTITGLGDDQSHCFSMKAETSGGQKDSNTIVKCLTLPDNGAPLFDGIKSLTFASGGAAVTWDEAVGQTTSYKVYYQQGTTLDFNTASVTTISAPATSANITGLADNRSWTFAVRAVDSHNNYDTNVAKMTATAGDLTPPTFVGYVSSVALSETSIQLVFQRAVDVDTSRYDIKVRQTTVGGAYTKIAEASQVSSGNITSTLTGLLPATSYDLLVTVLDTSGNPSTNSAYLTRSTLDLTAPNFGGVTSAAKKTTDVTKMMVYWNAAIDTGGLFEYRVFYSTQSLIGKTLVRTATYPLVDGGQTIYMSNSVANSATSMELSGLSASTTYYFVVHAVDAAGNEDTNTIQATATMPNFTAPAAVTGLSFSPAPGAATINRVPYVNGSGIVGNTAYVYVDGVVAGSQTIGAGGTFSIQLSLPNTSKVYVVTATQKNIDGVESNSASVGNYNLQVDPPTATISGAPTEGSTTSTAAITVTVAGANVANYKWAMTGSGADCNSASRSALTAVATNISHTVSTDGSWKLCVWGYDNLSNEQTTATSRIWSLDTVAPSVAATLTDAPTGNSNSTNVNITVGGADITQYRYVFTTQATACSSGGLTYSNFAPIATLITGNPGSDGNVRLCVKGADAAGNFAPITTADWVKITAPPTISSVTLSDKTTNSLTMTNVATVNAAMTGSTTLYQSCFKTANSTPAAGDSCWGATTQQVTLTTVNSSNTVYAWARDVLGNIQTTATTASITWTNYCDSGTFDGTCIVTTTKTIANGAKLGGVGSLLVVSPGTLNMAATNTATITLPTGSITVENGGTINGNYTVTAVNVDIQTGGTFSAQGLGYGGGVSGSQAGIGPSGVTGGGSGGYRAGGGTHAGIGGTGVYSNTTDGAGGVTTYGSLTAPVSFGSGGGYSTQGFNGYNGGGAIKLTLSGTLTVNGALNADGATISGAICSGSGAGGSLWINATDIVGTGAITARGGNSSNYFGHIGGAGGGGRVAIYSSAHMFHGVLSVAGGITQGGTTDAGKGTAGSLFIDSSVGICDAGSLSTTCDITSNIVLPNGYSISGSGNLTIASGVTVSVSKPTDSISIAMGGNVTVNGTLATNLSSLTATNLTVSATGSVNADGIGYPGGLTFSNGSGPVGGMGTTGTTGYYAGGGAHGGNGGQSSSVTAVGGTAYGSASNPVTMGSGGAGSLCAEGGAGGGAISISVTSTLTNHGVISANGLNGVVRSACTSSSGGGAGGSIHLTAGTSLTGSGSISAKGGDATSATYFGGGGGGGRIFIDAPNPFRGSGLSSINVSGGNANYVAAGASFLTYNGGSGSLYYGRAPCDAGSPSTTCTITGPLYLGTATLSGTGNLVVANNGNIFTKNIESGSINFSQTVTVESGGAINSNLTSLSAANLDIQTGGVVSANGLGYIGIVAYPGSGTSGGASSVNHSHSGNGGAYGGNGGYGSYNPSSVSAHFGTATKTQPQSYGSAGGGYSYGGSTAGGHGGGRIRVNVTGVLTVAGSLTVDGLSGSLFPSFWASGGGSGGALWISAGTIAGNGTISAKGGAGVLGVSNYTSGSGSGGRIAYDTHTTYTFSGTLSAAAGTISGSTTQGTAGAVGSICDKGGGGGCIN